MTCYNSYHVKLVDGPAQGFEYLAALPPNPKITVACVGAEWVRVVTGSQWPGRADYAREALPSRTLEDGDIVVEYHHVTTP